MKKITRILLKAMAIAVSFVLVLVLVGPFLIPIRPLEGLASPQQVAPSDSAFITIPFEGTDGIDIHYLSDEADSEQDETVFVLLHGSLFNAFTWNETMDTFSEYGRVIAYDQIPYGLSEKLVAGDWSGENPYSPEAAVDQLYALLDALDVDRAVLVGNSYGAVIAVQAALARPERVEALILVDAAVYVEEEMPPWLMRLPQVRRLGPLMARMMGQNEAFLRQTYLNPPQISDERVALTGIHTAVTDWDMALWEYLRVWSTDTAALIARLGEVDQPTLVISGDSDTIVPVADSEKLDAALPNSALVILPSCGHVPQEECPKAFSEAVAGWLDE